MIVLFVITVIQENFTVKIICSGGKSAKQIYAEVFRHEYLDLYV